MRPVSHWSSLSQSPSPCFIIFSTDSIQGFLWCPNSIRTLCRIDRCTECFYWHSLFSAPKRKTTCCHQEGLLFLEFMVAETWPQGKSLLQQLSPPLQLFHIHLRSFMKANFKINVQYWFLNINPNAIQPWSKMTGDLASSERMRKSFGVSPESASTRDQMCASSHKSDSKVIALHLKKFMETSHQMWFRTHSPAMQTIPPLPLVEHTPCQTLTQIVWW